MSQQRLCQRRQRKPLLKRLEQLLVLLLKKETCMLLVMIAQAILESANGKSALSQAPYYNFLALKGLIMGHQ